MVVEKRKQLILQIMQQQELNALSLHKLSNGDVLRFLRSVEEQSLASGAASAVIYWSSIDAGWMQPQQTTLNGEHAMSTWVFSDYLEEQSGEFCFMLLSQELSLCLYGYRIDEPGTEVVYQCLGSVDARQVQRVYEAVKPYLHYADSHEADRLDWFLSGSAAPSTSPDFAETIKRMWKPHQPLLQIQPVEQVLEATPKASEPVAGEDDFWTRIASSYPYPIAYPYRLLESVTNVAERYKEQLRQVENLLALLAGLSLAVSAKWEPGLVSDLKSCIISGVSAGHWRELIRKCTVSWKNSPARKIPLAQEISQLRIEQVGKGFGKAIEQLIRARNDFAHHRGPVAESQIAKEAEKLSDLLREAVVSVGFLCKFPIRIVREIDVLPDGTVKLVCLRAAGDHPALRQEELRLSTGFPRGQLIVDAGAGTWLSLYPFLAQETCSLCGAMEIYLLDKWKFEKNLVQLRSFERGHIEQSAVFSDSLKALLPAGR